MNFSLISTLFLCKHDTLKHVVMLDQRSRPTTSISIDDAAWIFSQAVKIARRDMFSTKSKFHKSFENNCQQESTPQTLRSLLDMILGGSNIKTQTNNSLEIQAVLSVAQCIFYNSTFRHREQAAGTYHNTTREPPLPINV